MDVKRYVGLNGVNIGYWDGDWKYHRIPGAKPYAKKSGWADDVWAILNSPVWGWGKRD